METIEQTKTGSLEDPRFIEITNSILIMRKVSHSSRSSESPNRGDKRRSISRSCLEKSSARSRKKRKRSYSPSSSSSSSSCSSSSSSSCCHSSDSEDDYKKQKMKKKQKLKKGKKKEKIKMKKIHKQEKKLRHLSKKLKKFKRNDATEIVVTRNEVPKCDATNNDTIRCDVIRNNVATTSASISKQWKDDDDDDVFGPSAHLLEASKARAPMTKEEWERQQSYVRRVFDPETGRHRLVKGTGEILEECVSRERHLAINRATTREDGEHFQSTIMAKIKKR